MSLLRLDKKSKEPPSTVASLCDLVDTKGQNIFRTINVELVCDACKRQGPEVSCRHRTETMKPNVDDSDAAFCPEFGFVCLTVTLRARERSVCPSCKSVTRYVFTWGCVCCMVNVCLACHVHAIIPEDDYRPIVCRECRFCDPETNPCTNAVTDRDE